MRTFLKNRLAAKTLMLTATLLWVQSENAIAASEEPVAINITGTIINNTCTVDTNGSDLNPELAPVSARDLKGVSTTAGQMDINIALKDCGKDITRGIIVTADGTPDSSDPDGYAFMNSYTGEGAATGVGLRFYKTDKQTPFKTGSDTETISGLTEGNNTLTFAAAYVSTTDIPQAGKFSSQVNLTIEYQ